jgi:transposase
VKPLPCLACPHQAQSDEAQQQRLDYWQQVSHIEPHNLVFLDEMGVLLGLMRLMGRAANLPAHKVQGVPEILNQVGAKPLYLSPYSPEFNPIEHWWWELKAFIRQFVPKTKETLVKLLHLVHLGSILSSSRTLRNYFTHCCYCAS